MLGRLVSSVQSGSNATGTNTYNENDVLTQLSPAPSGENIKQGQNQYDGLGRLTSSCAISSTVSGNVSCGQNTNTSASGILTTTAYTSAHWQPEGNGDPRSTKPEQDSRWPGPRDAKGYT